MVRARPPQNPARLQLEAFWSLGSAVHKCFMYRIGTGHGARGAILKKNKTVLNLGLVSFKTN